jgi:hypothetical protein
MTVDRFDYMTNRRKAAPDGGSHYAPIVGRYPSAFACRRDDVQQRVVEEALECREEVSRYLAALHADLRCGDQPSFAAVQLLFHPKRIAYSLPENAGVQDSPLARTCYFVNTHAALLEHCSKPLAARFLDVGTIFDPSLASYAAIPTLGTLAREIGHTVHRPASDYICLNRSDRWASAVLQEVAADVFAALVLAETWASRLKLSPRDVVAYYLAECLRYIDEGLGRFPGSDAAFLQLSYLIQLGALALEERPELRVTGDPDVVLAGLRSLARVLADALLGGKAEPAISLHRAFGPDTLDPLRPLLDELRRSPHVQPV